MTRSHTFSGSLRATAALIAAAPLLAAANTGYLQAGELDDGWIDRWQQQAEAERVARLQATTAATTQAAPAEETSPTLRLATAPVTRARVIEQFEQARDAGMLTQAGEAADTGQVLAAREQFNLAQAEQVSAERLAAVQLLLEEQRLAEQRAEEERQRLVALSLRENEVDVTAGESLLTSELREDTPTPAAAPAASSLLADE